MPTVDLLAEVRRLSDTVLYPEALAFVKAHYPPEAKQLHALLEFSRDWDELRRFVVHQRLRRWQGPRSHYGAFFRALDNYLDRLSERVVDEIHLLPGERSQAEVNAVAGLLGAEFVQHLTAHARYDREVSHARP